MQKNILITGATAGFGLACAKLFAANGWKLILTGRRRERLEALQNELSGVPVHIAVFDVSNRAEVEGFVTNIPEEFSQIDVLVNNAGLAMGLDTADQANLEHWETMVNTNITGMLYMTRMIMPKMVASKAGHIVNIGSVAAHNPYRAGNVYGATKAFVAQFSKNLRCDAQGTGIRVTNIEPGLAKTEFSAVRFEGDQARAAAVYEGLEVLLPEDIAESVLWAVQRPKHVNINTIELMATCQSWGPLDITKTAL